MSEEKAKTKDEFNNNVSTNNEISISYEIEQNKIQNSDNINNNGVYLTYGKYKIFTYDSKGDPLFLIGPDYMFFIAILVINLIYFLFLSFLLILCSSFYVSIIGVLLNIIQIGSTFICGIINPGLPKKEFQNEQLLINEPIDIKDVIIVFLLLINRNIMYIAKDVNDIVKDTTIIVLGLLNVLEELIFSIFMECLLLFLFFSSI